MKKLIFALILLVFVFISSSQVFSQNTLVIVRQPQIPGYYYPVAFSVNDSRLQKWIAENEKKRQLRKIEKQKMLQAQRKRLKELKARSRFPK